MSYQFKQDDLYSLINGLYVKTVTKGKEIQFEYCPYCKGGDHHDKYTFSVNTETGCYNCMRGKCGVSGHFVQLARDMNYELSFDNPQPKYRKYRQREIVVRDEAIEYLKKRGISAETVKRYKITCSTENKNIIVFPFYDDKGEMVFIKYRNSKFVKGKDKAKEWPDKDAKPILFGMWQCKDRNRLIITEGQIDSLTVSECNIDNATSVPMGKNNTKWIQNCYDFVCEFEEIVVFGDNENGKITLVDDISKYFSKKIIKVVQRQDYLGEKDANDLYRKFGKDAILTAIGNAKIEPVKAVKDLANVKNVNLMKLEHATTGIRKLDEAIGGLYFGEVAILTGKRGEGKSTFASQICANVLEEGYSIFVYSGELADFHFKNWLDMQIAGSDKVEEYLNDYGKPEYSIPVHIRQAISDWYRGRAFVFDNSVVAEDDAEEVSLFDKIEEAACRLGVKFVLLDNLMTALDVDAKEDLYISQSRFIKKLKKIAVRWNVFILVVAHPRKENDKELNNDSVSGSSDITNAVDLVFTYSRNMGEDKDEYQSLIGVTKNRLAGRLLVGPQRLKVSYSSKSKRIAQTIAEKTREYSCFKKNTLDEYEDILSNEDLDKALEVYTFTL